MANDLPARMIEAGAPVMRSKAEAKAAWDAERAKLRETAPDWQMPAWSRAPSWRRKPYYFATPPEESR